MGLFVIICAFIGLACVGAALPETVGKVVIALLKYVVGPVLVFMPVMFVICCVSR